MHPINRRFRTVVVAAGLVAVLGVGGLTACGGTAAPDGDAPLSPRLTAEEEALGLDAGSLMGTDPELADGHKDRRHRPGHHRRIGKRLMHGELVLSTEQGPRTVLVQRGEITAVDDDSMTVKSADGYTLTWTFSKKLRVFERRERIDGDALTVGEQVAVAGGRSGQDGVARLILVNPR